MDWTTRLPVGTLRVDRFSGTHTASYQFGMGGLFHRGVEVSVREADPSHLCNAEVNNAWSYTTTPSIRLRGVVVKHSDNFGLTFTPKEF
jgi:hypothetical protein